MPGKPLILACLLLGVFICLRPAASLAQLRENLNDYDMDESSPSNELDSEYDDDIAGQKHSEQDEGETFTGAVKGLLDKSTDGTHLLSKKSEGAQIEENRKAAEYYNAAEEVKMQKELKKPLPDHQPFGNQIDEMTSRVNHFQEKRKEEYVPDSETHFMGR